jgi:hypothetical protein
MTSEKTRARHARIVSISVALGELTHLGSSFRYTPVDRERREGRLSAFLRFPPVLQGFSCTFVELPNLSIFERDGLGSERDTQVPSRTPRLLGQNSRSLWLPDLSKLPARSLSDPNLSARTGDRFSRSNDAREVPVFTRPHWTSTFLCGLALTGVVATCKVP